MDVGQKQCAASVNTMKRGVCALALLGACALALPAWSSEERYRIDPQHTFSVFEYEHWGLSLQRGRFDDNSGSILFDPTSHTGNIDITIAAGSVSTGSALFDTILRSAEFFDADRHPTIRFRSSRLLFDGDKLARVEGTLSIKGVSRNIVLEMSRFDCRFMLLYGRRACGANGTARLSRSDFDLGRYVPFVGDAVTLYISVEAIIEPVTGRGNGMQPEEGGAPAAR